MYGDRGARPAIGAYGFAVAMGKADGDTGQDQRGDDDVFLRWRRSAGDEADRSGEPDVLCTTRPGIWRFEYGGDWRPSCTTCYVSVDHLGSMGADGFQWVQ